MSQPPNTVRVEPSAMERLAAAIMLAGGCTHEEAAATGEHLVGANLTGHDSHGLVRLPRYWTWLGDGTLNGDRPLTVVADTGALVHLDGGRGIGQYLALEAIRLGVERARSQGVAVLAMRRAGHIGRLGHYAEWAAREGFVTIQFCNVVSSAIVAPFGSAQRHMSTNPVAIGVPDPSGAPFILDFATSLVAEGKALVAATGGKPLPANALVDADGRPTGDPFALYGDTIERGAPDPRAGAGALRAMGEHKGSGLALACDLIAGALTGNGTNVGDDPFGNGWLAIVLDPDRLDDRGLFAGAVANYVAAVRNARPAQGVDRVRVPGDVERETRAERLAHGLPLSTALLDALIATARQAGLATERDALVMPVGKDQGC